MGEPQPIAGNFLAASVHVSNYEKALKFYTETVGFGVAQRHDALKFAVLTGDGLNLGVHVPWEGDTGRGIGGVTGLIFQTPDIKKAFDALKEQGVRIGEEPSERPALSVIMGTCYDPDDNEFVVWEPFK